MGRNKYRREALSYPALSVIGIRLGVACNVQAHYLRPEHLVMQTCISIDHMTLHFNVA